MPCAMWHRAFSTTPKINFTHHPKQTNAFMITPSSCSIACSSSSMLKLVISCPYRRTVPNYRKYSLHAIKHDVVNELRDGLLLPSSDTFWSRLKHLFKAINQGNPPLNVNTFNGGLFDPERHTFLEQYTVDDVNLCRAIDKLARVNGQFVDYRDLAERHLGTIYEGLLEYTLHVATEAMVELRSTSKIVPAQNVPRKDIANTFRAGDVYLATDRGERKLTGSYYTPDYIVKYMVDEALRPILDEAVRSSTTTCVRAMHSLAPG